MEVTVTEIAYKRWGKLSEKSANIRGNIFREFRELAERPPRPEFTWDIIWVFSGPETILGEPEDVLGNQDRERIETGLRLQREVTALRFDPPKRVEAVTKEDIRKYGPIFFYNGTEKHNRDFKAWMHEQDEGGSLEIPRSKIIVSNVTDIRITADQFEKFPRELLPKVVKLVLVSDYYHLPRILRLYKLWSEKLHWNLSDSQIVLYPTRQIDAPTFRQKKLRKRRMKAEIRAIEDRVGKGWLPDE
jgi:hypothetical protein